MNSEETLEITPFDMVIAVSKKELQPEPMEIDDEIDYSIVLFKYLKIEDLNFVLKEEKESVNPFDLVEFSQDSQFFQDSQYPQFFQDSQYPQFFQDSQYPQVSPNFQEK